PAHALQAANSPPHHPQHGENPAAACPLPGRCIVSFQTSTVIGLNMVRAVHQITVLEKRGPSRLAGASLLSQVPRLRLNPGCGSSNERRSGIYENGARQNRPIEAETGQYPQAGAVRSKTLSVGN